MGCECPAEKPIWSNGECIPEGSCPSTETTTTTTTTIDTATTTTTIDCQGGKVWNDCGSSCTKTCEVPNPICTEQCVAAKCQCPAEKPIWSNGECIPEGSCPSTKTTTTTTTTIDTATTTTTIDCQGGKVWNDC